MNLFRVDVSPTNHQALPQFYDFMKSALGQMYDADRFHTLLAFLLLFEELLLSRDISAVAFGQDILSQGRNGLPTDDAVIRRRLNRDFELLSVQ